MEGPFTTPVLNGDQRHHSLRTPLDPIDPPNIPRARRSSSSRREAMVEQNMMPNKRSIPLDTPGGTIDAETQNASSEEGREGDGQNTRRDIAELPPVNGYIPLAASKDYSENMLLRGIDNKSPVISATADTTEIKKDPRRDNVRILPADRLQDLASSPESLPLRPIEPIVATQISNTSPRQSASTTDTAKHIETNGESVLIPTPKIDAVALHPSDETRATRANHLTIDVGNRHLPSVTTPTLRSPMPQRTLSTPTLGKGPQSPPKSERPRPTLRVPDASSGRPLPSPMPSSIPLPPLSIPTYLQLELSSQRPSQLYIHQSANIDFPYESSQAKIERLMNFLLLPPHLESVLWFGTLACLDSWLYTFTILPLRVLKSFYILGKSWSINFMTEVYYVSNFVYNGAGRMWQRRRSSLVPAAAHKTLGSGATENRQTLNAASHDRRQSRNHQRTKSVPSALLPDDKADMLKGLLIVCTCLVLLRLDASRMYHWVRGQAAIKLYVIYNILEVCDRLFSAIGQDVLECLFSREALERKPDGHSKVLRPFWLFILALIYTVIHSTALFYQVITLNVAVNSYSNALITLLMSNQFVEIKGTVFKKFEKENLFQLTCADVVERFQLWHMLVIIASRNIVETGGLSSGLSAFTTASSASASSPLASNSSVPLTTALPPMSASSILPRSFTLVPAVVHSITSYAPAVSQVLGPFLVVLGSEMLVDWLKHAYINKFNNTRPAIYDRFLDVLAKDYYTHAFGDQNLTKRLGLPVIPLSCLLIRASVQTYQMFMAAWVPSSSLSSSTSLASIHEDYTAVRSTLPMTTGTTISKTIDDIINAIPAVITKSSIVTHMTTVLMFLLLFLILLGCKLVLGMVLLAFARSRYHSMKLRERNPIHHVEGGRRIGGWGVVEVDEDKRRWIYEDDALGMRNLRDREEKERQRQQKDKEKGHGVEMFEKVKRYEMVGKRIW